MILYLRKIAIIEDSVTDNVVNLTSINEGVDGSSVFGITNEHSDLTIEAGHVYTESANPSMDIRVLKPSSADVTQLETWADNQTDVYISGITLDGSVLWGRRASDITAGSGSSISTVKISINEQLSDNDILALTVTKKTTVGFDPNTGLFQNGIFMGKNLLGQYEWGDADADGLANGWDANPTTTRSFSNGEQTIDATTSVLNFGYDVFLPFEGESVSFSVNFVTFDAGAYDRDRLELRFFNASNASTGVETLDLNKTTGISTLTANVPANTVMVSARIGLQANTGSVTTVFKNPVMTIDGSTTYTKL